MRIAPGPWVNASNGSVSLRLAAVLCGATLALVPGCGSDDSESGKDDKGADAGTSSGGDGAISGDGATSSGADGAAKVTDAGASSGGSGSGSSSGVTDAGSSSGSTSGGTSGGTDAGSSSGSSGSSGASGSSSGGADAGYTGGDAKGTCGNGKCEAPKETLLNCAQDCAGGANCGDGKCEGVQENGFTCPKDCKTDAGSIVGCTMKNCLPEVIACMGDADCGKALGCVQGCKGDLGCMAQCGTGMKPATQQKLTAIVLCGGQKGCFGVGGSGGKCGDGKCEPPLENQWTCAKDCKPPKCGDGKCAWPQEQFTCPKDCKPAKCGDGKCEQLENALSCPKDCVPKTCGNGKCEKPAENTFNCLKDCQPGNPQSSCVAQKCGKEAAACGGDVQCASAAFCTSNCTDKACFTKCGDKLPGGSKTLFSALQTCADTNKCLK